MIRIRATVFALTASLFAGQAVEAQVIECPNINMSLNVASKELSLKPSTSATRILNGELTNQDDVTVWRGSNDRIAVFIDNACPSNAPGGSIIGIFSEPGKAPSRDCCMPVSAPDTQVTASNEPQTVQRAIVGIEASRRVNMRSSPTTNADNIVTQLRGQDSLSVLDEGNGKDGQTWYKVVTEAGQEGWIRGDLLTMTSEPVQSASSVEPVTRRDPGWAADIAAFIPAIDGCLSVTTAKPAVVDMVIERRSDIMDVRLTDAADRRWRCLVGSEGGTPIRYDPWIGGRRNLEEPGFVRSPATPKAGVCTTFEPVLRSIDNFRLGWLVFNSCE